MTEKLLAEAGAKLSAADKAPVEGAIATLKQALAGHDADAITRGLDALTQAQYTLANILYQQAGAENPSASPGPGTPKDAEVVDGEYVETT